MKIFLKYFPIVVTACILSACGDDRLHFSANLPDEFAIISLRPLTLPDDYNLLPPNTQSRSDFSTEKSQESLRASLLLQNIAKAPLVTTDSAFLFAAKADERDVNIRNLLEKDNLQPLSEPLNVAEAIALQEALPSNVRSFFTIKNRGAEAVKP